MGGVNCSNFVNGVCISKTASGLPWAPYMNIGVACVPSWPFGTTVEYNGKVWTCIDRGGAIKMIEGIPWVDFMEPVGRVAHGSIITVRVTQP